MGIQSNERLIRSIYDGVLAAGGWQNILGELCALTNSEHVMLLLLNCHSGIVVVNESCRNDCGKVENYEAHYADDDPCRSFIGKIAIGDWYFDMRELGQEIIRSHPFYQEFLRKHRLHSIMWTPLMDTGAAHALLYFGAGLKRPPFQPEDTKAVEPLLPHLIIASRLRRRYQELSSLAKFGQQMLDRLRNPVLLIDNKARILFANEAGQTWLSMRRHPYSYQSTLQQATPWPQLLHLARQICGAEPVAVGTLEIETKDSTSTTYLVGLPLREDHPLVNGVAQRVGMIVVHDPATRAAPWPQLLRQLFGFTPAECRLVEQLADDHSIDEAAEAMGLSRETIRSQLKSVFHKTGSRNQRALMHLIAELSQMR